MLFVLHVVVCSLLVLLCIVLEDEPVQTAKKVYDLGYASGVLDALSMIQSIYAINLSMSIEYYADKVNMLEEELKPCPKKS
jgi:hypothetical protein